MTPVNQTKFQKSNAPERSVTLRVTEKPQAPRDSFSSAYQFAEVLLPSVVGAMYMVFQLGFGWEQFFVYGLFLVGIGSSLVLLKGVEKVEKSGI